MYICYRCIYGMSLSDDKQADVIDAFNTTSRYLDDILNINNVYFDNMVSQIYPSELQLNKANASDTEAAFLDLHLSISNDIVSTKIYNKRDDFDFEIVNFPFLDGDVPRSTSYGVYRSVKKVISLRNISKVFSHFLKYIYGLSFTINVIKLSCNFVSINHINLKSDNICI